MVTGNDATPEVVELPVIVMEILPAPEAIVPAAQVGVKPVIPVEATEPAV
jgi:hypothetical protein